MKCVNCEHELSAESKFCPQCGTQQPEAQDTAEAVDLSPRSEENTPTINQVTEEKTIPYGPTDESEKDYVKEFKDSETVQHVKEYSVNYLNYFIKTLKRPTSGDNFVLGTISLVLFTLVFAYVLPGDFWETIFSSILYTGLTIGIAFGLGQVGINKKSSIQEVVANYGSLFSLQIILLLGASLVASRAESIEAITFMITLIILHGSSIFLVYIFRQSDSSGKIDRYYQVLLSFVAFVLINAYVLFNVYG